MSTRLYLVRHGDTTWAEQNRFAGAADVPLSDLGRERVDRLARRLSSFSLSAIYSSPLRRARETAEALARPHGLTVFPMPQLREIDHGDWEGLTFEEVEARYPGEVAGWKADPLRCACVNGENGQSVLDRALPALERVIAAHPEHSIVVVSHKVVNRLLIARYLGLDPRGYREKLGQRPACLNVLDFGGAGRVTLNLLNDVSHYAPCADPEMPNIV
ncbi:MAG: histidine phosphatase family protein [Chloroflexi bacterium]|nr:histidine phosphatase family protein [Chloroflexota bacterium]